MPSKFFSTLLLLCGLLFTTACASNPSHRPQPNEFGDVPFERSPTYSSGDRYEDVIGSYSGHATMLPTQPTMEVSWMLVPPSDRRPEAYRFDCEIVFRDGFAIDEVVHECDRVEKNGNDYVVYFNLKDVTRRINITAMPGGFTTGGFYEQGVFGLSYGNNRRVEHRIVWSTHEQIRRYRWSAGF